MERISNNKILDALVSVIKGRVNKQAVLNAFPTVNEALIAIVQAQLEVDKEFMATECAKCSEQYKLTIDRANKANEMWRSKLEACQQEHERVVREIWDNIICPMCYRLNPQHATMDYGAGCHSCAEKSKYIEGK